MLYIKDGKIHTVTGRLIPAPTPIRLTSNRKCSNDVKKVDAWLVVQAVAEAKARRDEFNQLQFEHMNPARLSPCDKDSANDYLFGETNPVLVKGNRT